MTTNGKAQAGAAGAAAGAATGDSAPGEFATKLVKSKHEAQGVSFTSDHPIGGDYPPVPPMPAEEQHAAGYQPLAAEHEAAARAAEQEG